MRWNPSSAVTVVGKMKTRQNLHLRNFIPSHSRLSLTIRLATPFAPAHRPKLELPNPAPVPIEDCLATAAAPVSRPKTSWLSLLSSLVTAVTYRLAVFGTRGCAELLTPEFDFRFSPTPSGPPTGRNVAAEPEIIQNRGSNTLLAELEAFAAAIRGEKPYPIPVEEVLHGVTVFEAIIRSAATGQPVKVPRD